MSASKTNTPMTFITRDSDSGSIPPGESDDPPWKVLVVDDEEDVHTSTIFALKDSEIFGRPIQLLHAYNSEDALKILKEELDIAVILVDVVMESSNAGLDLIDNIRNNLQYNDPQIIIRTGQPNQAPEQEIIKQYEINDYKLKTELTQSALFNSLTTAIRSYRQINRETTNRQALNSLFNLMATQLSDRNLHNFANLFILHLSNLYHEVQNGLVCAQIDATFEFNHELSVLAAIGEFTSELGKSVSQIKHPQMNSLIQQCIKQKANIFHKSGMAIYLGSPSRGDMVACILGQTALDFADKTILDLFATNIKICADNLILMKDLKNYAFRDQKLKIPNRNALSEDLHLLFKKQKYHAHVLIKLGVDHFSEVNLALGEEYGDHLLLSIADRIRSFLPRTCQIYRLGGDTFAILGPEKEIDLDRLNKLFRFPFFIGDDAQTISITIGVLKLEEIHGTDEEALKAINVVHKLAKLNHRGGTLIYKKEMLSYAKKRLQRLEELRYDFVKQKIFLAYQPIYNIQKKRLSGLEALMRWEHKEGEFVSPTEFIPLAEQSGFINRLGRWAILQALEKLNWLHNSGWPNIKMAINLSVLQLQQPDLITELTNAIQEFNIPPEYIELEITESVAMKDFEQNLKVLNELKKLGIKLALDDFGTGFSSLSFLRDLPIDRIKIDKHFIQNIDLIGGKEFIELIIQLGHTLDMSVTAEGIETIEQLNRLHSLNCDCIQGFYFAKPMAKEILLNWLNEHSNL
ncbi:EAL domain-containing protein [Aliikangiella maris]|uniref:EAL domain-containing protein n=2 Tax=Aliikangiella maris TaxID=3162458 RepID=A0ABV3MU58_9GAMM